MYRRSISKGVAARQSREVRWQEETEISSERAYSSSREEFGLKMESITLCSSSGSTEDTGHRGRIAGVMP